MALDGAVKHQLLVKHRHVSLSTVDGASFQVRAATAVKSNSIFESPKLSDLKQGVECVASSRTLVSRTLVLPMHPTYPVLTLRSVDIV